MHSQFARLAAFALCAATMIACAPAADSASTVTARPPLGDATDGSATPLALLLPQQHDGPLTVVATTSMIGDVAAQVGGDLIDLTTLIPAGTDPHAWAATPQDLVAISNADLLLINGLGLEEATLPVLKSIEGPAIISVNESVPVITTADQAEHHEDGQVQDDNDGDFGIDPHTWQDPTNVRIWVQNIAAALSVLDQDNAVTYAQNATAYDAELVALQEELTGLLDKVPADARKLVTDHDDLGYFAKAYNFEIIGAVLPSASALASVSAQQMAALQKQIKEQSVKAIFVGTTLNPDLANQLASDTGAQVVSLFTDSLSDANGPAASYLAMMRYNAQLVSDALAP